MAKKEAQSQKKHDHIFNNNLKPGWFHLHSSGMGTLIDHVNKKVQPSHTLMESDREGRERHTHTHRKGKRVTHTQRERKRWGQVWGLGVGEKQKERERETEKQRQRHRDENGSLK